MQTNRASGRLSQTCWSRIATNLSPTYPRLAPLGPHRRVVRRPLRGLLRSEVGEAVGEVEEPALLEKVRGHRLLVARVEPLVALDSEGDLGMGGKDLKESRGSGPAEPGQEEEVLVGHGRSA